ncbi:MAG: T9SS C-terminal target domain-containing protein [Ignavibacteriae bacterium]|nr:MAG: T9SS C-terminal target domain-containing protein [Ignavibacteriota bacterium]
MRTKLILISFALLLTVSSAIAQDNSVTGAFSCYQKKISTPQLYSGEWDSPNAPKHKFDVLDYKLNVDIYNCFLSPYPKTFTAYVIVKFRVDTALSSIQLNALNTSLQINSVGMAGASFTHTNNIVTITLDRTYNPNEIAEVRVNYQHLNVADQGLYTSNGFVFTDFPPEGARKVFPCWDRPSDKATWDLTAKVPLNARLGSNGRLNDSLVTGDTIYYHWISRDPIATYLMVMTGKISYNLDIIYWHKISNPNDSIPIRFYFNTGENITAAKQRMIPMTTYYSQRFGEYPFEKAGFATLNNQFTWGGMENQTLISLMPNGWTDALMSHEFAHMWFGDLVTCGTWADVWLNEGFATYCEALWIENNSGYAGYKNSVNSFANTYLSQNPGFPMYNPAWAENTPGINTLYNYAVIYCKGAGVLHMLRYTIGDSLFFAFLNSYATDTTDFKHKTAVTDDFTTKLNQVTGQDLTWFMNQWVKQPNHPVYQNAYSITNIGGGNWKVNFIAKQIQTNTPFHKMPVQVKVAFTSGPDTTIRVMNDVNNQEYEWTFNRQPAASNPVVFDPGNDIVLKSATTVIGIEELSEVPFEFALHQNYPNPFNPVTSIKFDIPKRAFVTLKIYNVLGELAAVPVNEIRNPGKYTLEFDGSNLPSGIYFYEINAGSFTDVKKMALIK